MGCIAMEDKTFELMTKMYSDFSNKFEKMDKRFDTIENDIKGLKSDVIRLENKQDNHSKALFDSYKLMYEKLQEHDKRFDTIESKLEKQDIEIRVIKGGKA